MLQYIPRLVTSGDIELLNKVPTMEEIQEIVEEMDANSAAGPDGFNGFL